jgi:uncharacterized Fe-S cluster-containing MiaB family protein
MTLDDFAGAAQFLREHEIRMRAFVLVKPPFQNEEEARHWGKRSIDFAFDCAATAVSLIPTRFGNGALESLANEGNFAPPTLELLESMSEYGIGVNRGRVFSDLWDLEKFARCESCFTARRQRLYRSNLQQTIEPRVDCALCEGL